MSFPVRFFMKSKSPLVRAVVAGVFFCAIITLAGCGGTGKAAKLYPASGKVTVDGAPLTSGTVNLQPDEAKGNSSKFAPSGMIDSSGNYKLTTDGRDGAPLGWYKVGIGQGMTMGGGADVSLKDPSKSMAPKASFNMKYQTPAGSGLSIEIVENPPAGAYDIKLTK